MITNLVNPALKLAFGTPSATISFSTNAAAPIQVLVTGGAGGTQFTVDSTANIAIGDFLSIEGASLSGTTPWVNCVINFPAALTVKPIFPSLRTAVNNAVAYRYERFETRYKASKVTLTNTTNGDVYVWDMTLADDQAKYTPSGGSMTTLTTRGILNRSNCIAIHPNLLPINSNFTLKCDYDYYT